MSRMVRGEVVLAWGESDAVRAVAAVVAAAARDLLAGAPHGAAFAPETPIEGMIEPDECKTPTADEGPPAPLETLDERVLDLPPPLA